MNIASVSTASCTQLTAFLATLLDAALTASGTYTGATDHGPTNSRLHATVVPGVSVAGWSADRPLGQNQYIQVCSRIQPQKAALVTRLIRVLQVRKLVNGQKVFKYTCICGVICNKIVRLLVKNIFSMQVDLQQMKYIVRIATQCRSDLDECVSSYYVKVASTAADDAFTDVCGFKSCPQLFIGNEDINNLDEVVTNEFDWPAIGQFVRLNPQSWLIYISLRWEVYGCNSLG